MFGLLIRIFAVALLFVIILATNPTIDIIFYFIAAILAFILAFCDEIGKTGRNRKGADINAEISRGDCKNSTAK